MADDPRPPFWLVWRRFGRSPVFEHESYQSARAEAERLSRANPGQAFYVLAPVARGAADISTIRWPHYAPIGISELDELYDDPASETYV